MSARLVPGGGLSRSEHTSCLILPVSSMAPRWARQQITAALSAWQLPRETVQTAELAISELVTNAAKISGCESFDSDINSVATVAVVLRLLPGQLLIEVIDDDSRPPVLGDADTDEENGRGLFIVQAVSKEWGYYAPPSGGKVVFAVLPAEITAWAAS